MSSCATGNHCGLLVNGSTGNDDRAANGNFIADGRAANGSRTTDGRAANVSTPPVIAFFVLVDRCSADSDLTALPVP